MNAVINHLERKIATMHDELEEMDAYGAGGSDRASELREKLKVFQKGFDYLIQIEYIKTLEAECDRLESEYMGCDEMTPEWREIYEKFHGTLNQLRAAKRGLL